MEKEENTITAPVEADPEDPVSNGGTDEKDMEPDNQGPTADSARSKKWVLLLTAALIIVLSGIGIKLAPDFLNIRKTSEEFISPSDMNKENLKEQNLSPFFIPPSKDSSWGAARIDLSVIWDTLASIRFGKNKLIIRDKLYNYITEMSSENKDLNSEISIMEEGIAGILRDSLGVRDLVIKIKEIKYF